MYVLYVCMCVCMYVCMYIYIYIYIYMYTYTYTYIGTSKDEGSLVDSYGPGESVGHLFTLYSSGWGAIFLHLSCRRELHDVVVFTGLPDYSPRSRGREGKMRGSVGGVDT